MVTFPRFVAYYSYKGGVGRSLALANTAFSLAAQGSKVLIIDMDFEAPGQHMTELFVQRGADRNAQNNWPGLGMLELLNDWVQKVKANPNNPYELDVRPYLRRPREDVLNALKAVAEKRTESNAAGSGDIWLLPSGQSSERNYAQNVRSFDWDEFSEHGGGSLLDALRHRLGQEGFDYVLIDTRTGYSEEFLVAGLDLADTIVVLSSYNRQNIEGTRDIMSRIEEFNQARQAAAEPHLRKRVILIGSPQPAIGQDNLTRRLADIHLQWPELVDFNLHLPYVPELALEERINSWEQLQNPAVTSTYTDGIEALTSLLVSNKSAELDALRPSAPKNPFDLLRGGHIDSSDVVRYFVDPGGNIVADMEGFTPLVITGARGTGKTMLARRLCIDEWLADQKQKGQEPNLAQLRQIGLYFHIDSDVLHSFNQQEGATRKINDQLFPFFFDIIVLRKAIGALDELGVLSRWTQPPKLLKSLYSELGEKALGTTTFADLLELLERRLTEIRLFLNNPTRFEPPIVAAPNILFKRLAEHLRTCAEFKGRFFAIHIDEFENFEGYQQRILNTRLKHARQDECVTYRFYMRSGGFATMETLAPDQSIENIHDFRQHSLDEELDFDTFKVHALRVANRHLELSPWFKANSHTDMANLLQDLSPEDEAQDLAAGKRDNVLEDWLKTHHSSSTQAMLEWFRGEPSYLRRAVGVVMLNQGKAVEDVITGMTSNDKRAQDWYHNYHRGALHWLCRLHRKDKQYSGLNTLVGLSGNNIRVFNDFCHASFSAWLADWDGAPQALPISVTQQNRAVRLQARILRQNLWSAARSGPEINRFLERFGRLCEAVHKSPRQSEPEVNHFALKGQDVPEALNKLLRDAWFEGVVRQLPGNKQKSLQVERLNDWQLAPWLCPLFNLSSRRKKKMTLHPEELNILFNGDDAGWKLLWRAKEKSLDVEDIQDDQDDLFT